MKGSRVRVPLKALDAVHCGEQHFLWRQVNKEFKEFKELKEPSGNTTTAQTYLLPSLPFSSPRRVSYSLVGIAHELLFSAIGALYP